MVDGISTRDLDAYSIAAAVRLIAEKDAYSTLAAVLTVEVLRKEVVAQGILSFPQSVQKAHELGLVSEALFQFVIKNSRKLDNAITDMYDRRFNYFGLEALVKNHLLRSPSGEVIETPQYYLMRMAANQNLSSAREAVRSYRHFVVGQTTSRVNRMLRLIQIPATLFFRFRGKQLRNP